MKQKVLQIIANIGISELPVKIIVFSKKTRCNPANNVVSELDIQKHEVLKKQMEMPEKTS